MVVWETTIEVKAWISNYIMSRYRCMEWNGITYPCLNLGYTMSAKGSPDNLSLPHDMLQETLPCTTQSYDWHYHKKTPYLSFLTVTMGEEMTIFSTSHSILFSHTLLTLRTDVSQLISSMILYTKTKFDVNFINSLMPSVAYICISKQELPVRKQHTPEA